MVRSQRRYKTNLDYEKCKAAVLMGYEVPRFIIKTDLGPEKGEKLLTFRLKKYPDHPLQLSPKKHILAIHGIKPNKFLLDLRILKELASYLKHLFPEGVNFKFYKETLFHYDLIEELKMNEALLQLAKKRLLLSLRGELQSWQNKIWDEIYSDPESRKFFSLLIAEYWAKWVALNGICFMPNGSIKLIPSKTGKIHEEILQQDLKSLLEKGLL